MQIKKSTKPDLFSIRDIYKFYVNDLLKKNPHYWGECKNGVTNAIIYRKYRKEIEVVLTYKMFSDIIGMHNKKAGERIIAGESFSLGSNLGFIRARCVERNFKNKSLDYHETKKRKAEILARGGTLKSKENPDGEEYRVIRLDENYVRIGWNNPHMVKNIAMYEFKPATNGANKTSLMNRFSRANQLNPMLRLKYEYYPYVT